MKHGEAGGGGGDGGGEPSGAGARTAPRIVCVVGSLNADLVLRTSRFPQPGETVVGTGHARFPGGKGANQACAAARLAAPRGAGPPGAPPAEAAVAFIGRVGADADGAWLRESLAGAGVDVAGLGIDPRAPTGMAVITVDEAGQNQIVLVPGAYESLSPQALEPHRERLARAHVLLLQLEIPLPTVEAAARIVRAAGGLVVLDPAPAQPVPDALLALCDYVTPNESELCALVGRPAPRAGLDPDEAAAAARRLLARGARAVIVKRGAAGALLVTPAGHEAWPAFPVRAVDTTAAGDTFNGALAAGLAEGLALADAGRFACAAAALAVTRPGAQPSIPDRAETLAFLRAARP